MPAALITVRFTGDGTTSVTNSDSVVVRLERNDLVVFTTTQWNALSAADRNNYRIISAPVVDEATDVAAEIARAQAAEAAHAININTQTVTPYQLVLGDAGKRIRMNLAGANSLVIPLHATVAFPVGAVFEVVQTGAGKTTVAGESGGVTINSLAGNKSAAGQHGVIRAVQVLQDTWTLDGDLIA